MRKRTIAVMAFVASLLIALVAAGPASATWNDSYGSIAIGNGKKPWTNYQNWTTDGTGSTAVTITLSRTDYGRFNRWCNGTTFAVPIPNGGYEGQGVCYGGGPWHASLTADLGTYTNGFFRTGPTWGVNDTGSPVDVTITVTK
jgi:hypothetical protein